MSCLPSSVCDQRPTRIGPGSWWPALWLVAVLGLGPSLPAADPTAELVEYPETPPAVLEEEPELQPPLEPLPPTWWERHRRSVLFAAVAVGVLAGGGVFWLRGRRRPPVLGSAYQAELEALRCLEGERESAAVLARAARHAQRAVFLRWGMAVVECTTPEFVGCLTKCEQMPRDASQKLGQALEQGDRRRFDPAARALEKPVLPSLVSAVEELLAARPQPADPQRGGET